MALLELAARVEALSGADRNIDATIWEALGVVPEGHCKSWCNMDGRTDLTRAMFAEAWSPRYTASLDAAMSLVPEGFGVRLDMPSRHAGLEAVAGKMPSAARVHNLHSSPGRDSVVAHTDPILALVSAALRARSAEFGNIGADGVQS